MFDMLPQDVTTSFAKDPGTFSSNCETGSGLYSKVTTATIPGFVVKTCDRLEDDAWVAFAAGVITLGSLRPGYLPAIEVLVIDEKNGRYFALMEELVTSPLPGLAGGALELDVIGADTAFNCRVQDKLCLFKSSPKGSVARVAKTIPKTLGAFTHILACMALAAPEWAQMVVSIDLHSGNGMVRESTGEFVFTDPFIWDSRALFSVAESCPKMINGLRQLSARANGRIVFI